MSLPPAARALDGDESVTVTVDGNHLQPTSNFPSHNPPTNPNKATATMRESHSLARNDET